MNDWFSVLPQGLTTFLLVLSFSLLIGLSQRRLNLNRENFLFGTDRTFTLIGLLGYLLYLFSPNDFILFLGGGASLTAFLGISYYFKVSKLGDYGITSIITALITYCMGPLVCLTPSWLYVSVVVAILLLTEMKSTFVEFAHRINNDEFITLAKFLLIAFIILPMLPDKRIVPEIALTPYRIWLATVIVSGISYVSYLIKRYLFPQSGVFVSGILGGLYSSTATVTILGRKCKTAKAEHLKEYAGAMFMAVGMMFLRLMIIIAIFNTHAFLRLAPAMVLLMIASCVIGVVVRKGKEGHTIPQDEQVSIEDNPLEFKVALIFAVLYVVFTALTYYTMAWIGTKGLTLLAFLSGAGDITPFILNLMSGSSTTVPLGLLTASCLVATCSNNLLKMGYALGFSGQRKELIKPLLSGFGILSVLNLIAILFLV
jgi:uncharacterized membrane protein (DUF4010 family)